MPLKVSDGIGAYIDDFKKSDAPQFKGKSEKERRDMGIAAYLSAKNGPKNENVKTADRKPEMYTRPDGKRGVRMVPVDKEVISKEDSDAVKAFLAKGGKITKLPPGKAQGYHGKDDPGKDVAGVMDKPDTDKFRTRKKVKSMEAADYPHMMYNPKTGKQVTAKSPADHDKYAKMGYTHEKPKMEALNKDDKPFVANLVKKLRKGSKTHGKQADDLEKAMTTEVKQPPKKEVMKVIGHTKNAVQGRAALRKKYGVSDKEADDIIHKAMTEVSGDTLSSYMSKASDASKHRGMPTRKVDNRYSGVAKAQDKMAKAGMMGTTAQKVSRARVPAGRNVKEDTNFEVNIEGLPMMFMSGMSPGEIKAKLRGIVKQPSMINGVKRVTDATVRKSFRLKAQGKDEQEDD